MERMLFDATQDDGADWTMVSDRVMGGVSEGHLTHETVEGRPALRLTGEVRLDNNGGFLQMARDMDPAGGWNGLRLVLRGNGEAYNLHLRTDALDRPWQSFRATVHPGVAWQTFDIGFADLTPHRTRAVFDPTELTRLGIVAIGHAFAADVALASLALFARRD